MKRAVALAALAALAGVDVIDAAECRGPSSCGCSNDEFCKFDYGSSGGCESCSSFSSAAACGQDGLPSDGEDDCAACCFGRDAAATALRVREPDAAVRRRRARASLAGPSTRGGASAWLGLASGDAAAGEPWAWVDGCESSANRWHAGSGPSGPGAENCAEVFGTANGYGAAYAGLWSDKYCGAEELACYCEDEGVCFAELGLGANASRQLGGSCYYYSPGATKWTTAEQICDRLGGHLACVNDETEATFLADWVRSPYGPTAFWIGLNDRGNEQAYDWSNKKCCSNYRRWDVAVSTTTNADGSEEKTVTRQPEGPTAVDTAGGLKRARCVTMGVNAGLNKLFDEVCSSHFPFVCEAPASRDSTACAACGSGTFAKPGDAACESCAWGTRAGSRRARGGDVGRVRALRGNLGRPQRAALVSLSILMPVIAGVAALVPQVLQHGLGSYLARRGLAYARAEAREQIAAVASGVVLACGAALWLIVPLWLRPLRQREDGDPALKWPFRGRKAATSEANGCDPGGVFGEWVAGCVFFFLALFAIVCAIPVVDARASGPTAPPSRARTRPGSTCAHLGRQRRKWEREERERSRLLLPASDAGRETARADALNAPCGHALYCAKPGVERVFRAGNDRRVGANCANRFREENGPVCHACGEPSQLEIIRAAVSTVRASQRESPRVDARRASAEELELAISRTKQRRSKAKRRFLERACASCHQLKDLVVDMPCGHANVCADCAAQDRGADYPRGVCRRCDEPSAVRAPVKTLSCSICFDEVHADFLASLGACGHTLCASCSIGYVRNALGDVEANGVVETLVARDIRDDMRGDCLPLASEEYDRLARFLDEAHVAKAERFYCCHPTSTRDLLNDEVVHVADAADAADAGDVELAGVGEPARTPRSSSALLGSLSDSLRGRIEAEPPFATCPYCERASCVRCKVPAHRLVQCSDVATGGDGDALTAAFVSATSKACPRCGFRITHSHGHACHHIKPGSGCPNCGHHFCYACLAPGTSGSVCGCRLFCSNDGILDHVALAPYPRDARCGCTFCNVCRPNAPCEQCTGRCVVCLGIVPPGPSSVDDIEGWRATGGAP
ncbi:hypothetical protein JL722_10923 [Aureococcus anophagefferens]|nr:hypothetical protein JL722_10923 [Aureococcus anophagefferens]